MKRKCMSLLAALIFSLAPRHLASAQERPKNEGAHDKMSHVRNVQLLIPETTPKSVGYSQLAIVTGGKVVFISGQVALDKSGNVLGKDDFHAQVQQVFENLKAAVEAAGGTFHDVIKLNSYVLDVSYLPAFREVRDKYIDPKNPPASTAIQVARLVRPEFLVEVEAVAVVGDEPQKAQR
jgi:enamine deaminase RidA (YjgF/YER057c/UK114 family)